MLDANATKSGAVDTAGAVRWGGRRGRTGADDEFQFQIKAAISRHSGAKPAPYRDTGPESRRRVRRAMDPGLRRDDGDGRIELEME